MPVASQPTSRWANLMPKLNHPSTGSTPWHNPSMKLVHLRSQHSQISQKVQKADRTKTSQLSFYSKFIDDFEYKYCCLEFSHEHQYTTLWSLMSVNTATPNLSWIWIVQCLGIHYSYSWILVLFMTSLGVFCTARPTDPLHLAEYLEHRLKPLGAGNADRDCQ